MEHSYYFNKLDVEQIIDVDLLNLICKKIEEAKNHLTRHVYISTYYISNASITYIKLYGYQTDFRPYSGYLLIEW